VGVRCECMSTGCTAGPVVAMDGRIVCCGIISSFQSAATSENVKRLSLEFDLQPRPNQRCGK